MLTHQHSKTGILTPPSRAFQPNEDISCSHFQLKRFPCAEFHFLVLPKPDEKEKVLPMSFSWPLLNGRISPRAGKSGAIVYLGTIPKSPSNERLMYGPK